MKLKTISTLVLLTAVTFAASLTTNAQRYSGQGYAGSVEIDITGQPVVTSAVLDTGDLPANGGTITQSSVGLYALPGGVLQLGDRTVSTSGVGNQSQTLSSVNTVNFSALGITDLVTAGVVSASTTATCPNQVLTANSSIANLVVNGVSISVVDNVTQTITVDLGSSRVLTVIVNERIQEQRSITANALHITLRDPLAANPVVIDVVVVSARSGIHCGLAPVSDLYSGRGTAVRVDQDSLLIPHLSTIIADTGWLPSAGTAPGSPITSTTAGAGVSPIVTTSTAFSTTEGGDPAGTAASSSQVEDLVIQIANPLFPVLGPENILTLAADVVLSNTQCQCSLSAPACSGDADIVGLTATALGIPVTIPVDPPPNTELVNVTVPLVASVRIVANEQVTSSLGTYSSITVNALIIEIDALDTTLVDTDIKVAHSHSDIACGGVTPTAAGVMLSGRAVDPYGRAISRVVVSVMGAKGFSKTGITNSFGYYMIKDIPAGETYIVSASARAWTFSPRSVSLTDDLSGFDLSPDVSAPGTVSSGQAVSEAKLPFAVPIVGPSGAQDTKLPILVRPAADTTLLTVGRKMRRMSYIIQEDEEEDTRPPVRRKTQRRR